MDAVEILERLCRIPTVSFHERQIAREIVTTLRQAGVEVKADRWGNICASLPGDPEIAPLIFVAHMDHPGFEAVEIIEETDDFVRILALPRGGLGRRAYDAGMEVKFVGEFGTIARGTVESHGILRDVGNGRFVRTDRVIVRHDFGSPTRRVTANDLPAPIILDLPDFQLDGDLIRGRQLDDLAGCAAIISALIANHAEEANRRPAFGLFTRAEEVGLVGAALAAGDDELDRSSIVVSVETSLKSETARQGDGVIIRTGDRVTTFDHHAEAILHSAARRIRQRDDNDSFKVQRALMSAGGCEATAFKAHGFPVTGTSFPLGAWHNTEDDGSIQSEYVHRNDFNSGVELLTEAMKDDPTAESDPILRSISAFPETDAMRLRETIHNWPASD